jgi:hypothetical protein
MKKITICKAISFSFIAILSQTSFVTNAIKNYRTSIFESFNVVSDAIDGIQKVLDEEKREPYRISRTYKVFDDQPISVVTKTHYKQYRKKPSYDKQVFASHIEDHDSIIEFIYKCSDKNHIVQINRKTQKNVPKIKKIAFNKSNNQQESNTLLKV